MSSNALPQARRANGVRLSTETRSRRCLQPVGSASVSGRASWDWNRSVCLHSAARWRTPDRPPLAGLFVDDPVLGIRNAFEAVEPYHRIGDGHQSEVATWLPTPLHGIKANVGLPPCLCRIGTNRSRRSLERHPQADRWASFWVKWSICHGPLALPDSMYRDKLAGQRQTRSLRVVCSSV